ncbi:putative uncharacterized protein DDB_G0282133, partial [Sitodiplosis mosellana]|uniref:putative uncharacterized protein DDB_G0282133 n=1 Tax=Sitodiplosis mosellana TaxID=263140 RepID=UPI0024443A1F
SFINKKEIERELDSEEEGNLENPLDEPSEEIIDVEKNRSFKNLEQFINTEMIRTPPSKVQKTSETEGKNPESINTEKSAQTAENLSGDNPKRTQEETDEMNKFFENIKNAAKDVDNSKLEENNSNQTENTNSSAYQSANNSSRTNQSYQRSHNNDTTLQQYNSFEQNNMPHSTRIDQNRISQFYDNPPPTYSSTLQPNYSASLQNSAQPNFSQTHYTSNPTNCSQGMSQPNFAQIHYPPSLMHNANPSLNYTQSQFQQNRGQPMRYDQNISHQQYNESLYHSNRYPTSMDNPIASISSNDTRSNSSSMYVNDNSIRERNERGNRDFLRNEGQSSLSFNRNNQDNWLPERTQSNLQNQSGFMPFNNSNMSTIQLPVRQQFLRRLKLIPKFDGATHKELVDFIDICDTLYESCMNEYEENEYYEQMALQLRGEARQVLVNLREPSWSAIKERIYIQFKHLANKDVLNSQLENLKQEKEESLTKFAERARKLLQEKNAAYKYLTEDQKIEHNRIARKAFSRGITDTRLRNRLITRGASSLEDAVAYAIEAENDALYQIPRHELFCGHCRLTGHRERDCRNRIGGNNGISGLITALQSFNTNQSFNRFGNNNFNRFNRNRILNNNNRFNGNWNNGNRFNGNWNSSNRFNGNWNNNNRFNGDRFNWNNRNRFSGSWNSGNIFDQNNGNQNWSSRNENRPTNNQFNGDNPSYNRNWGNNNQNNRPQNNQNNQNQNKPQRTFDNRNNQRFNNNNAVEAAIEVVHQDTQSEN